MEESQSWQSLVNLQFCLIQSRQTNEENVKQINHLVSTKEALQLRQAERQSPRRIWTIYLRQEDAEIARLKQEKNEKLLKQQELKIDLNAAIGITRKITTDVEQLQRSINEVEVTVFFFPNIFFLVCGCVKNWKEQLGKYGPFNRHKDNPYLSLLSLQVLGLH